MSGEGEQRGVGERAWDSPGAWGFHGAVWEAWSQSLPAHHGEGVCWNHWPLLCCPGENWELFLPEGPLELV